MATGGKICLKELEHEYEKSIEILFRITNAELKESKINVANIVDNIASLGAFKEKNIIRCDILSEFHAEHKECENSIINITENARRLMIDMLSRRLK